jgi:aldehyde:ferredoxin oxidoreductase
MLDDYYDERGWDMQTGIPREKTLIDLGLKDVAADLRLRGLIRKGGE